MTRAEKAELIKKITEEQAARKSQPKVETVVVKAEVKTFELDGQRVGYDQGFYGSSATFETMGDFG